MKIRAMKWLCRGLTLVGLVSVFLIVNDEWQPMFAWWATTAMLLPMALLSLQSPFLTFRVICLITFVTQFITVPSFFFTSDDFKFTQAKPIEVSAIAVLPILVKVMVFLMMLGLIFNLASRLQSPINRVKATLGSGAKLRESIHARNSKRPEVYTMLIATLIIGVAPLNIWMFQHGISIVGVEPPTLPYRLSGILHYLTKYIIPLTLGYLYYKIETEPDLKAAQFKTAFLELFGLNWLGRLRWHLLI